MWGVKTETHHPYPIFRVAKTFQLCQPAGANFSQPVLISLAKHAKICATMSILLIVSAYITYEMAKLEMFY